MFGNNKNCKVKGYGKVNNGNFTIKRVAYVDGSKDNLISASQLVIGIANQVLFDEEGSVISNKETKQVLLNSMSKGDLFTVYIKPIVDILLFSFYRRQHLTLVGFGIKCNTSEIWVKI